MENLNNNFSTKTRTAKQCRERYVNYSKFSEGDEDVLKWKTEQFEMLFE